MPRPSWPLALALGILVFIGIVIALLPLGARWVVAARVTVTTGRETSVADVDLNLFTRRLVVSGLAVHDRDRRPPLAEIARVDARFRLLALLRGRVHVDDVEIADPIVRLVRLPSGAWNVDDVLHRLRTRPTVKPVWYAVDRVAVRGGRVLVRDERVAPAAEAAADGITLDVRDVGTDRSAGSAFGTLTLAGAPVTIAAERIHASPPRADMTFSIADLDVRAFAPYVPGGAATLSGGMLGARVTLSYDGGAGVLRAESDGRVTDVAITRAGLTDPLVSVPTVAFAARDVVWKPEALAFGRLEARGAPRVIDASVDPAQRFDMSAVEVVLEHGNAPTGRRADVRITAALEGGGRLDARGKARLIPFSSDLEVSLSAIGLHRLRPYFPPASPAAVAGGTLHANLSVSYDAPHPVRVNGQFAVADLVLARSGQPEPFARDPRLSGVVTDLRLGPGTASATRVAIAGTPTVLDTTASPPQRYDLTSFSVAVEEIRWPAASPFRIGAAAALADGSRASLAGTLDLRRLRARARGTFTHVDASRARAYVPAHVAVRPARGRVNGTFDMTHDRRRGTVVDGGATVVDAALDRAGLAEPFFTDSRLVARVSGLAIKDGQLTLDRLAVSGAPSFRDARASPAATVDLAALAVTIDHATWPARDPLTVKSTATFRNGGTWTLDGAFHPGTLAAHARAVFTGVDLALVNGWVPAAWPFRVRRARASATLDVTHERDLGVSVGGTAAFTDVALAGPGAQAPLVLAREVTTSITDLTVDDGTVRVRRIRVDGAPSIVEPIATPPRRLDVPGITLAIEGTLWPGGTPARITLAARTPGRGDVAVTGTMDVARGTGDATASVRDVALGPFRGWLPVDADVAGSLDASLQLAAGGEPLGVSVRGRVVARDLALGPAARPLVTIATVTAGGLDARWPARDPRSLAPDAGTRAPVRIEQVVIDEVTALVERDKDGSFALRRMLTVRGGGASAGPGASAADGPADAPPDRPLLGIAELQVNDASVRFVDRSTTPFYSEEARNLGITVRGLTGAPQARATLRATGVVGGGAALDVQGEIAPFAEPFSLDLRGSLQGFAIARTNPYLRPLLDWIALHGLLTTKVRYRIAGDTLEATNDVTIERLDVQRAGPDPDKLLGLPLGLVVSLLKDTRGDIHLTVPVSGSLGSPAWSFGDALFTAFRNVLARAATAPFRAVGSSFTRGDRIEQLRIDPLVFTPGTAVLTPDGVAQVQRVADFLRASPYVRLELRAVTTTEDVAALKAEAVARQVQGVRTRRDVDDAAAIRRLYRRRLPDAPEPKSADDALAVLREQQPIAQAATETVASRRLTAARQSLVDAAGIQAERLVAAPPSAATGDGRVEFRLLPAPE
jgi:hypothetical protein